MIRTGKPEERGGDEARGRCTRVRVRVRAKFILPKSAGSAGKKKTGDKEHSDAIPRSGTGDRKNNTMNVLLKNDGY